MTTFSSEQLNFFKFSTVVLDEFPVALRHVFVDMWDNQVAPTPGFHIWDDSPVVRKMFLTTEGGKTKYVPTNKSFKEWDCTALFEATLYAKSFAMPDGKGGLATLGKLYVKPHRLRSGSFHHSVISHSGNQAETFALGLDQLRLLRNSICHQINTQKIDKATFDRYIQLSKDAFVALGQPVTKIDGIGKLGEKDFPTARLQQLEEELRREKFKQIEDNQEQIESQIKDVSSDVKDVKTGVTDVKAKVEDVGSDVKDVKNSITEVKTKLEDVSSDVKNVKTGVTDVKTIVEDVGSDVKAVGIGVTDVKAKVEDVGSDVKDVKTEVTDVTTKVKDVGSDVKDVKTGVTDVKAKVKNVGSDVNDVKTGVTEVKTKVQDVSSDVEDVKTGVSDVKTIVEDVGLDVKDVKTGVTNVTTKVEDVGSDMKDVKTGVTDVKTKVQDVGSDMKDVKTGITDVRTEVKDVWSHVKALKTELKDVKSKVEDVGSDLKTSVTDLKTEVKKVGSDVEDIKHAIQSEHSKGYVIPAYCVPDKVPHFFGRQKECEAILHHLTARDSRLVDTYGPPGFGKTAVAINVAHRLVEMKIPVYFISLRGMKSKTELVLKLLSIFADVQEVPPISPSHRLIQCLQQHFQNHFVLILDNADDLLESGDTKVKEEVLKFTEEILTQCRYIKLLFTTRESLEYLSYKLPVHLERVGTLDRSSSASLVNTLLKDVSEPICSSILRECGQVPLAMRIMCSTMREANVSFGELLEELRNASFVEVLDDEYLPYDTRLKTIINTSFQRLGEKEKEAFVSLAIFPGSFGTEEASAVLDLMTAPKQKTCKNMLRSLKRKSLIECNDNNGSFTIHSLLRSFIEEKRSSDREIEATFHTAELRFYDYNITSFGDANDKFLTGHSNDAFEDFVTRRETIVSSFVEGTKEDKLFSKAVDVLSKAELFLYSVLSEEELLFNRLYDTAFEEAKKRNHCDVERKLLAAKYFGRLGWFYFNGQSVDRQSLQADFIDAPDCPAKLLWYLGIYELLCGKLDEGISYIRRSVNRLGDGYDERVLTILAYHVLAVCYRKKEDEENASYFETICDKECNVASLSPALTSLFLRDTSLLTKSDKRFLAEQDAFFFVVMASLLPSVYKAVGDQMETEVSNITRSLVRMQEIFVTLFKEGRLRVRVFLACCNALHVLSFYKEAAKGFNLIIIHQLENALENHEHTAQSYHSLGLAKKELKEYEAAFCSFKKAFDIRRSILQETLETMRHRNLVRETINSLSSCCSLLENFDATTADVNNIKVACEELEGVLKEQDLADAACFEGLGCIYNNAGTYYLGRNDSKEALMLLQRSIEIKEENLGDHVDTCSSIHNEGAVYLQMKRYNEADKSFHRALDLRKRLGIEDHEITADTYHLIGASHFERGGYNEALKAELQCLRLREKHLGDHQLTATSFNDSGLCYYKIGKYEEAIKQFQNAVELRKRLLGNHADTALSFHNLSETYFEMENYPEALEACSQALNIRLELLPEHVNTARSLHLQGSIHSNMGNFKAAFCSFKKAFNIRRKISREKLETMHRTDLVRETTNSLSCCCSLLENFDATTADVNNSKVACEELEEENYGDHLDSVTSLQNIGVVYLWIKRYIEANKSFRRVLDLRRRLGIEDHENTADTYHLIGASHFERGGYNEALKAELQCLRLREKHLGDHQLTATSFNFSGHCYYNICKYEEAIKQFQNAVELQKRLLGNHADTALSFHNLSATYFKLANYSEALDACSQALNIRLELLPEHVNTARSLRLQGSIYLKMGNVEAAYRSFRREIKISRNLLHRDLIHFLIFIISIIIYLFIYLLFLLASPPDYLHNITTGIILQDC